LILVIVPPLDERGHINFGLAHIYRYLFVLSNYITMERSRLFRESTRVILQHMSMTGLLRPFSLPFAGFVDQSNRVRAVRWPITEITIRLTSAYGFMVRAVMRGLVAGTASAIHVINWNRVLCSYLLLCLFARLVDQL